MGERPTHEESSRNESMPLRRELPMMGFLGSRVLTLCLLAVYLVMLAWIILLKMQVSLDVVGTMRSVNLIPLAGATEINGSVNYQETVLNFIAFMPFGLYLGMLTNGRPLWRAIAPLVITSLAFEILQFVFAMGVTDITDLLANSLGGAVGLALYFFARLVFRSGVRTVRIGNVVALVTTVGMTALVGVLLAL